MAAAAASPPCKRRRLDDEPSAIASHPSLAPAKARLAAEFVQWFTRRGGSYHEALQFRHDHQRGLGLYSHAHAAAAKNDNAEAPPQPPLRANSEAVRVPLELCLTSPRARSELLAALGHNPDDATCTATLPARDWIVVYLALVRLSLAEEHRQRKKQRGRDRILIRASSPPSAAAATSAATSSSTAALGEAGNDDDADDIPAAGAHLVAASAALLAAYRPYVALLPSYVATPHHWSLEERKLLGASTPLAIHVRHREVQDARSASVASGLLRRLAGAALADGEASSEKEGDDDDDDERRMGQTRRRFAAWLLELLPRDDPSRAGDDDDDDDDARVRRWRRAFRWARTAYTSRCFPPALTRRGTTEHGRPPAREASRGRASRADLAGPSGLGGRDAEDADGGRGPVGQEVVHDDVDDDVDEEAPILVPGLDVLNHGRGRRVTWLVSSAAAAAGADVEEAAGGTTTRATLEAGGAAAGAYLSLVLHDDVAEGQEALNNYGAKTAEEMLAVYGFVPPLVVAAGAAARGGGNYDDDDEGEGEGKAEDEDAIEADGKPSAARAQPLGRSVRKRPRRRASLRWCVDDAVVLRLGAPTTGRRRGGRRQDGVGCALEVDDEAAEAPSSKPSSPSPSRRAAANGASPPPPPGGRRRYFWRAAGGMPAGLLDEVREALDEADDGGADGVEEEGGEEERRLMREGEALEALETMLCAKRRHFGDALLEVRRHRHRHRHRHGQAHGGGGGEGGYVEPASSSCASKSESTPEGGADGVDGQGRARDLVEANGEHRHSDDDEDVVEEEEEEKEDIPSLLALPPPSDEGGDADAGVVRAEVAELASVYLQSQHAILTHALRTVRNAMDDVVRRLDDLGGGVDGDDDDGP